VGAGVHWNAQPMFQPVAVIVKAGLVQLPSDWVGPSNKRAGAVVVVVGEPVVDEVVVLVVVVPLEPLPLVVVVVPAVDVEVLVEPEGTVVLVELPPGGTVVLVEVPAAGGSV
jgi:hypothetical protein